MNQANTDSLNSLKHRQTVYISDPDFPKYRSGEFTGWLTESNNLAIAYIEVFDRSSRKKDHLETVCVSSDFLSCIPPIR
ncbi:hypothetical protein HCU40_16685 [Pseudanabaena biceps]|nr:hypothetical protein [Pseudanabaena biceps]NUN66343.1 hypothetical protein [Pseudanabaena biceps]